MKRTQGIALVVAGSLLVIGAPVAWLMTGDSEPETFGDGVAVAAATPSPVAPSPSVDPGSSGLTIAQPGTKSAQLVSFDPPAEIRVAGLQAPIDKVGLTPERDVVIPEDVSRTGWYELGPAPGSDSGSAVIVGHVDDKEQGLGTFASLPEVGEGDEVTVVTAGGEEIIYDVVALEQFNKEVVPLDKLFTSDGPPRLVLISCGGEFDSDTGNYESNVVVTAVPKA